MGIREYASEETGNVTLTTTAETVVATLTNINTAKPGERIRLHGMAQLTTGTATTTVTPRIRRDSVTGTVVNEANAITVGAAAGSTETFNIDAEDSFAGEVAGQTYVLTLQQAAATADGTSLYGYLTASIG